MKDLSGRTALVTGASSGLGVAFAGELAARGCRLILAARREDRLNEVAARLRDRHAVETSVVKADLGEESAPEALFEAIAKAGHAVDILVNNAGFGVFGKVLETDWRREREMLQVDVVALLHLTRLFAPAMVERGWGRILQVSSIGAFQPTPTYATYSAAKSFVRDFSEAFNHELKGTGVTCTAVMPGITMTEFLTVSGQRPSLYQRLVMMTPEAAARTAVRAMLAGRPAHVPGLTNLVTALLSKILPRRLSATLAHRMMTIGQTPETPAV